MGRSTKTAKKAGAAGTTAETVTPTPQSATHLLGLPEELLGDILGRLPLVELMRARQVCRQFRATVARLEAEDERHYFKCGARDAHAIRQLPHTVPLSECDWGSEENGTPCTCGAFLWTSDELKQLLKGDGHGGGDEDDDEEAEDVRRERYAGRHEAPHPPVRWALLAPARALALEIAQQCAQVDTRTVNSYGFMVDNNDQEVLPVCGWVPTVVYLPDDVIRPTQPADMLRLAAGLFSTFRGVEADDVAGLLVRLASQKDAAAFYRENGEYAYSGRSRFAAAAFPDDWREAWKIGRRDDGHDGDDAGEEEEEEEDDDDDDDDMMFMMQDKYEEAFNKKLFSAIPSFDNKFRNAAIAREAGGWVDWEFSVRRLAAAWRLAVAQRETRRFRRFCLGGMSNAPPFNTMDNAQVTAYLDSMVATVDTTRAFLRSRCDLPVVFTDDSETEGPRVWVGGLSPGGLLVGAMTILRRYW